MSRPFISSKIYLRRRGGKIYLKLQFKVTKFQIFSNKFHDECIYFILKNCDLSYLTIIFNSDIYIYIYNLIIWLFCSVYAKISRILVRFI